MEIEEMEVRK